MTTKDDLTNAETPHKSPGVVKCKQCQRLVCNCTTKAEANRFTAYSMAGFETQCERCKHMRVRNSTCDAYPDGIPNAILTGEWDHTQPYVYDQGIHFEPK